MSRQPSAVRPSRRRRGVTLIEATVAIIVVVVVVALALPSLSRFRERGRRLACQANLHQIGQVIDRFRTADSAQAYPAGASYSSGSRAAGTSWWLAIMPYSDMKDLSKGWQNVPDSGNFGAAGENPNVAAADGYRQSLFFCPSSPLPPTNDPARHWSEATRRALGAGQPAGIAVPSYAALAGGAPDARDVDVTKMISQAAGRNTSDGPYGILSSSGMMPVNRRIAEASARDPKGKTILLVEQSGQGRNDALDPPDLYDLRSAWPRGMFMGSTGDYGDLRPTADGVNGSGDARAWNVTTLRYPINTRKVLDQPGIVVDPATPRPANPDDPPPPVPPYPPEGYGPGHNHGIIAAHPGGAHVLMADGSVRFLNEEMDLPLLLEISTRDDGRDSSDF